MFHARLITANHSIWTISRDTARLEQRASIAEQRCWGEINLQIEAQITF